MCGSTPSQVSSVAVVCRKSWKVRLAHGGGLEVQLGAQELLQHFPS